MYRYRNEKLHVNHFLELRLKELRWELTVRSENKGSFGILIFDTRRLSKEMITFLAGGVG